MFSQASVCSGWGIGNMKCHGIGHIIEYPHQKEKEGYPLGKVRWGILDPPSDIWWWSLETCSNLFIWGPPWATSGGSNWNWSTYSFQIGGMHFVQLFSNVSFVCPLRPTLISTPVTQSQNEKRLEWLNYEETIGWIKSTNIRNTHLTWSFLSLKFYIYCWRIRKHLHYCYRPHRDLVFPSRSNASQTPTYSPRHFQCV